MSLGRLFESQGIVGYSLQLERVTFVYNPTPLGAMKFPVLLQTQGKLHVYEQHVGTFQVTCAWKLRRALWASKQQSAEPQLTD